MLPESQRLQTFGAGAVPCFVPPQLHISGVRPNCLVNSLRTTVKWPGERIKPTQPVLPGERARTDIREGNGDKEATLLFRDVMLLVDDRLEGGSSPGPTHLPQLVLSFVHDMPLKPRVNPRLLTKDEAAGVNMLRDG